MSLLAAITVTGCGGPDGGNTDVTSAPSSTRVTIPPSGPPSSSETGHTVSEIVDQTTPATTPDPSANAQTADIESEVVALQFSSATTSVDVIIVDNSATRDLLRLLPLTLRFEEFNGREKIAYLPRDLDTTGTPGSDPDDGDLIYYEPWGNLGLYYNTQGIGFDDNVIHLGTYEATPEQLAGLEGDVHVVAVDR